MSAGDVAVEVTQWRCFHCGDVFTDPARARQHFGRTEDSTPACVIKGADGGLLKALRDAEEQADDAIQAMHAESTDAAKAYNRQRRRHTQALIAAEESGYEKGLRDGCLTTSDETAKLREALEEIADLTQRRQLPLTHQINDLATTALQSQEPK